MLKLNTSDGSVSTWSTASRSFIGEPIFIQRGVEEDDGYVLVIEAVCSVGAEMLPCGARCEENGKIRHSRREA